MKGAHRGTQGSAKVAKGGRKTLADARDKKLLKKDSWPPWVQDFILPYLRDKALWPVTFALLGHVAVLHALMALTAWRSGNIALGFLFVAYVVLTLGPVRTELRYEGRPGVMTFMIVLTWVSTVLVGWWADTNGYF